MAWTNVKIGGQEKSRVRFQYRLGQSAYDWLVYAVVRWFMKDMTLDFLGRSTPALW